MIFSFFFCCVLCFCFFFFFFFSSRRRHTRSLRDWSSDVCSSDLLLRPGIRQPVLLITNRRNTGCRIPGRNKENSYIAWRRKWPWKRCQSEIGRASCRERV